MKRRNLTPQIMAALRDTPVVYVQGPRQAGKSTLAQSLQAGFASLREFIGMLPQILRKGRGTREG
jgi:predicted AAA+ superfamily ATPase